MENKKRYLKFIAGFLGIIAGVFILSNIVLWGWQKYEWRQQEKLAQKIQENIRKLQEDDYQKAMADTYGGKTPQETLRMYIDAVDKGDFELASKYFIEYKKRKERDVLFIANSRGNIDFLLDNLKILEKSEGYFSANGSIYTIEKPIFIEFTKYPNGIWKILEI